MARGRRWRLDEYIICLDLYLRLGPVGNTHPEVIEAAKLIGRTPGAIATRLGNFQFVDPNRTGPGLGGGERACQRVWDLLAHDPNLTTRLAHLAADLSSSE